MAGRVKNFQSSFTDLDKLIEYESGYLSILWTGLMTMDPMLKQDTWAWMVSTLRCNSREMPESGCTCKKNYFLRVRKVNEYLLSICDFLPFCWQECNKISLLYRFVKSNIIDTSMSRPIQGQTAAGEEVTLPLALQHDINLTRGIALSLPWLILNLVKADSRSN